MTTLQTLYQALKDLDKGDQKHVLETISYDLTQNNQLGLDSKKPADFHVGIPYNSPWPADPTKSPTQVDSTLKAAFLDVLEHGITAVKEVIKANSDPTLAKDKKIFIDITQLGGISQDFFLGVDGHVDATNPNNLAHKLGALIDQIPSDHTPVIRFLIGNDSKNDRGGSDKDFNAVFWPNGNSVVKQQQNAQLCVGYYSPNFTAKLEDIQSSKDDLENLAQLVRDMVNAMEKQLSLFLTQDQKQSIDTSLAMFKKGEVVTQMTKKVAPAISWNHAKMLAVHGQTLLTGGGNYWSEYVDGARDISDLQCKIKGNATFSAHLYCDHLWKYLSGNHNPDDRSWRHSTPLTGSGPSWNDNAIPAFERAHGKETGGKSVLAVAKLGDWVGQMEDIQYPIQAIDAMRDLALNVIYHVVGIKMAATPTKTILLMYSILFKSVTDAVQDKALTASFQTAKVTPAAWASRITRCKAIAEAKEKVYIDAEIIGCFLQQSNKEWKDLVLDINKTKLNLAVKDYWDGILWPYDLIAAIGQFMKNVDVEDKNKENGVYILLTAPEVPNGKHEGWGDLAPISALKDRIKTLAADSLLDNLNTMERWFNKRCHVKRISKDGSMYNHTKAYCVDKKLLYIGSDNPYPNYNEEHGVWIDDKEAIDAWYDGSWKPRWDKWAKEP